MSAWRASVIRLIPEFLDLPGVLGIGEIGLNKNTPNESIIFFEQAEMAAGRNEQILIHTPHLDDKYKGTRMILDMLADLSALDHGRVLVDHVEEHTIRPVLEQGYWAGMTCIRSANARRIGPSIWSSGTVRSGCS